MLKTQSLLDALRAGNYDAAFGGARRDEEKSRAKERIFSFRDSLGQWDPKNQRPELWNLFNGRVEPGESIRVFPLSNWTELDVWQYIHVENIPIVPLYFAKERQDAGAREFADHAGAGLRAAADRATSSNGCSAACGRWDARRARARSVRMRIRCRRLSPSWWRCGIPSARIA